MIKCSLFLHRSKSFINSFNVFFSLSNFPWLCEVDKIEQCYICKKKVSICPEIFCTHTIAPLSPTTYGTVTICILALEGTKGLVSKINETPIKKRFQLYSVSNALSIVGVCYLTRRPCGKSSFLQTALLWEASSEQS